MKQDDSERSDRFEKAKVIAGSPEFYKVCEGCDSIVASNVTTCPNCSAYRFDDDPFAVVAKAEFLGARERRSVISEDLM